MIMKKLFYACLGLTLLLGACSDKEDGKADEATIRISSKSELVTIAADGQSGTVRFEAIGGSAEIAVTTNQSDWKVSEVTSAGDWCKAVRDGGKLTITADPNAATSELSATVKLTAGAAGNQAVATLKVTQLGKDQVSLRLTSESELVKFAEDGLTGTVAFAVDGGSAEIAVATNQPDWTYKAEAEGDWCDVVKADGKLTISAPKNPTTGKLTAKVTVTAGEEGNQAVVTLDVTQEPQQTATLSVAPEGPVQLSPKGETLEMTVTTNQEVWDARSDKEWLTVEKADGKFTLTAGRNETDGQLTATVTVTAGEGENVATTLVEVSQDAVDKRMIFVFEPTTNKISLPLAGYVDVVVNWGDGSAPETFTEATYPSHEYAETGKRYEVTVAGTVTTLNANNTKMFPTASKKSLVAIKQWGNIGLTNMRGAFYQCSNLAEVAADPDDAFSLVNTMMQSFYQCSSLKSIPEGLFDNCPDVTTFQYAFQDCKALESVPATLFAKTPKVTSFQCVFQGCTSLAAIPAGLFDAATAEGLTFASCFSGCTGLTAIPADLFANCVNATTFSSAFDGCKNITEIPAGLFRNNAKANYMASIFANTGVTAVPAGLFDGITAEKVNFGSCFKKCTALETIPAGLFDKCLHVTTFSNLFEGCTSLKAIPAGLFDNCTEATNFMSVFLGCTSLTSVPTGLFDNNKLVFNFKTCFSGCTGLTGESPFSTISVGGVDTKVHLYERNDYPDLFKAVTQLQDCFKGCTGLSDYDKISADYPDWM